MGLLIDIPVKYELDAELPVPSVFRETFDRIIRTFLNRNNRYLGVELENVSFDRDAIGISLAQIKDYPASRVSIGTKTWESCICMWQGDCWDVLIDLHIDDEADVSDLVLSAKVLPDGDHFKYDVGFVHVP